MRFGGRKREDKLYKQWSKYAGLPREAIPQKEAPADKKRVKYARPPREAIPEKESPTGKKERPFDVLYILLGVSLFLFGTGLVLLLIQSC